MAYLTTLRNQARIQEFETVDVLLRAFEKVTLRERGMFAPSKSDRKNLISNKGEKIDDKKRSSAGALIRCHNCDMRDHVKAKCPTKNLVRSVLHVTNADIASECAKKTEITRNCLAATRSANQKYIKNVLIQGRQIKALIDFGSDLILMRTDEYMKLRSPQLRLNEMRFRGVKSDTNTTLEEFETKKFLLVHYENRYMTPRICCRRYSI